MVECPTWRLTNPHYLNVPGTTWERVEVSRDSGEQANQIYAVPRLVNPEDPRDCNRDGDCVVYNKIEGAKIPTGKCYEFVGTPTPEMEAMNEEAEAITAVLRHKWDNPIDSIPVNGGMDGPEKVFMEKMMLAFSGAAQANNQSVPKEQYDELKDRLLKLEKMLEEKALPIVEAKKPTVERRV